MTRKNSLLVVVASIALLVVSPVVAKAPRALPDGKTPNDSRIGALKDLNGHFPFRVPATLDEWKKRKRALRRRVLVATGLWPKPEKTPLRPRIWGKVERDGFTVEKAVFESVPGHFVTGLLFRPSDDADGKKRPAVLCPHGHGGRLQDHGEAGVKRLIERGEEKWMSGRFPKLARCAQLARMGCVVYIFDMLGYADSVQISRQLAHRFAKQRPEFDTIERWGLFSTQAELRMQSVMGIQTWNSVRALDFLASLPDVDAKRIAVTGGSGGGTQTILLGAIDPRPVAAFPQGMVSTSMQGGCTCENCSLLRVDTGNVELAALFAPRPQAMTAANDWTKAMMEDGYPELQKLYALYGAKDRVFCKAYLQFPHNYNYVTRAHMYSWFNRHLELGLDDPIVEKEYRLLEPREYTIWDDEHAAPPGGDDYERALTKQLDAAWTKQFAKLTPRNERSLRRFRRIVGGAFETIIGRGLPDASGIEHEVQSKNPRNGYLEMTDLVRFGERGEELPVVWLYPREPEWNGQVVIWIDGDGKDALYAADGAPRAEVAKLLARGAAVLGADLLFQGEFLADGKSITRTRVVSNPREFAGYTFAYNHTLFARRVHDILTLMAFVRGDGRPKGVHLMATNGAGPWAAAASALAGSALDRRAIDTRGFRFVRLKSYRDINFIPGAVKYGDLPGLLALSAPRDLRLGGEKSVPKLVADAYAAAGAKEAVTSSKIENAAGWTASAAMWLVAGED